MYGKSAMPEIGDADAKTVRAGPGASRRCSAHGRRLVAMAHVPAGGKSMLAGAVAGALNETGHTACLVPLDGFHLDNRLLSVVATSIPVRKRAMEPLRVNPDRNVPMGKAG